VNPVGAGRGLVSLGWEAGLYEGGSTQHAAYLGGDGKESNLQERNTARRIGVMPRQARAPSSAAESTNPAQPPTGGVFLCLEPAKKMTEYWVFQDKSSKRACIHRSNCSVRQGTLNPDRSEGTWHGAFPTYEKARRTAAVMSPQKRAQLNCRLCHPQDF
jgi:hypothetical protein